MSVLPSVPHPTAHGSEVAGEEPIDATLLHTLYQQLSEQPLSLSPTPKGTPTLTAVDLLEPQGILDQLLHTVAGAAALPTSTATATAESDLILTELRQRLAALPTPSTAAQRPTEHTALRQLVEQFNPNELGALIHELFGKLDLIMENRRLLSTLQEINQFFEGHITERLAELDDANARLRQLNHQKDHLLGMVAHDLRGPLGNIKFAVDLLKTLQPTQDEYTHFLQMIEETTTNALYLTNDLLDTAAIEAGQLTIKRQPILLQPLVERVNHSNRHIGTQKQIDLQIALDPTLEQVTLDELRMEQVLGNLLSNAFKYSHAATTVTLTFLRQEQDLVIQVADQGQGIPADEIGRLFELFGRSSVRPTGQEKSTGLGLAICKRIVEAHGGTISVESTVGKGTTFTIVLPSAVVTPIAAATTEAAVATVPPTLTERRRQRALNSLLRGRRSASIRPGRQQPPHHWAPTQATVAA